MKNKQKEWHTATKPLILHPGEEGGFVAYYCANATNRVNTCSVLEPARMTLERLSRSRASGWYQSTDAR